MLTLYSKNNIYYIPLVCIVFITHESYFRYFSNQLITVIVVSFTQSDLII